MTPTGNSTTAFLVIVTGLVLMATACSERGPSSPSDPPLDGTVDSIPALDERRIQDGRELYGSHCAVCHGVDLRGDPNWKTPNADGSFRPPPQDASGHTWHHPDQLLIEIISEGTGITQSAMPKFDALLTQNEILSIIEFLKSTWGPDELLFQSRQTVAEAERGEP